MTAACQPLPRSVAEDMLQVAARSLCVRAGDTPEQFASRTRQMICSILGFEPRDGLEYMLATMVVGHFHLILDSMREALWGQMDSMKARTKTSVVSLDRAMLGFVKEMRLLRLRPLARWAEEAQRQAEAAEEAATAHPAQSLHSMFAWTDPPSARAAASDPAAMPAEPATGAPAPTGAPIAAGQAAAVTCADRGRADRGPAPGPTKSAPIGAMPAGTGPAQAKPVPAPAPSVPPPPGHRTPHPMRTENRPAATAERNSAPAAAARPTPSPLGDPDEGTTEEHIAAFEAALAALTESLAEARAHDDNRTEAMTASGDQSRIVEAILL